ncbi:heterokaryon incompatibility 6 OR allele [Fusarium beomiforme]|uniref:Heterokaryon incompatibility 6 OR allele n=1 Tax=Fusarium beomiforme TaxID=44412 RepID=A0A9P5A9G4_9HYPO|nr:heterokaryon incompatibility 6 OR allele [Fusarium beomiforme]
MAEKALTIDYAPLAQTNEIRILILKRGVGSDPIICALCPVKRGEAEYHALSYEWGDESENDPSITVTSRPVQVRRNLYEALKSIRKRNEDLHLWVDAVCINQADIPEKNHQVAIMGEIFANAVGVISWLGPASDDSDMAMDLMSDANQLGANLSSFYGPSAQLTALTSLCYRAYWRRVWIIQELHLAQSYEVWCGEKHILVNEFDKSLNVLDSWVTPFTQELGRNPANHHRVARVARDVGFNNLSRWIWVCFRGNFQCTREQDFVYALLNISGDYQTADVTLEVDYAKSPREVFLELLKEKGLPMWSGGSIDRWFKLAEMMNLPVDDDLRRLVYRTRGSRSN